MGRRTATRRKPRPSSSFSRARAASSCPPADKLFTEYVSAQRDVLALSYSVDYWDYLGWKDTLANRDFSERQRDYAAVRGDRQVYTPQVVINGGVAGVGSDKAQIEQAILKSRKIAGETLSLPLGLSVEGTNLVVNAPDGKKADGRSMALSDHKLGFGCDHPRREQRPHSHLPQCRSPMDQARRMERHGEN